MSKPLSARADKNHVLAQRANQTLAQRKAQADSLILEANEALRSTLGSVRGFTTTGPLNYWLTCCLDGIAFASVTLVLKRGKYALKVIPIAEAEYIAEDLHALTDSIGELLVDHQERTGR